MQISPVNIDARKKLDLRTGDTVRVMQKIQEKEKTRLQPFEGMIIAMKHGKEAGGTFTVRRSTGGYGVEKIYPLFSPMIDSIEILKRSKVKKSKLYHIRDTALKQISKRMKMMFVNIKEEKEDPNLETENPETPENLTEETKQEITETEVTEESSNTEQDSEETPKENEAPAEAPTEESEEDKK